MAKKQSYEDFLAKKKLESVAYGIPKPPEISDMLFEFQRDIVRWALKRGRAAIFADCGLGKTAMQIEWARHVASPRLTLAQVSTSRTTRSSTNSTLPRSVG